MLTPEDLVAIRALMEDVLEGHAAAVAPEPPPQIGGLFDFHRPTAGEPAYGSGIVQTTADRAESIRRACHAIDWAGLTCVSGDALEEVWAEIERLKKAAPDLLPYYQYLDPSFAGFGLLTGLFDPQKYDSRSFGVNANKRVSHVGQTIEGWVQQQLDLAAEPGGPSGVR